MSNKKLKTILLDFLNHQRCKGDDGFSGEFIFYLCNHRDDYGFNKDFKTMQLLEKIDNYNPKQINKVFRSLVKKGKIETAPPTFIGSMNLPAYRGKK